VVSAAAAVAPGGTAVPVEEEAYDFFDDELLNEGELGLADPQTEPQNETTGDGQRTVLLERAEPGGEAFDLGEEEVGLDFGEPIRDQGRSQSRSPLASSAPTPTRPLTDVPLARSAPEATAALFADDPDGPWQSDPAQQAGLEGELSGGLELEDPLGATGGGAGATVAFFETEARGVPRPAPPAKGSAVPRLAEDPLTRLDPDDLARETVLDPAGGRNHDVSWSDLGEPLAVPEPGPAMGGMSQSGDHTPTAPTLTQLAPRPAATPRGVAGASLAPPPPQSAPAAPRAAEPPRAPAAPPVPSRAPVAPAQAASAPRVATADISPVMRQRIHDTLEKVAWEAFSDLSDTIVRQVLERFEAIAWEVIPQMAEALVREEIRRMKGEEE
jgi:hypothetical protein